MDSFCLMSLRFVKANKGCGWRCYLLWKEFIISKYVYLSHKWMKC
jgi:hypothetical protein